jgi:hypothetical protein
MVKNPISRQVASISRATACLDASADARRRKVDYRDLLHVFFSP